MNYEDDRILNTYLLFHYGTPEEILAGSHLEVEGARIDDAFFEFPVATVTKTFELESAPFERALDLGCAVGRSAFELSKFAAEVIGIDFSQAFVEAAESLCAEQTLRYRRYSEAHLGDDLMAAAPNDAVLERVAFETGDAMNLRDDLGAFDLVHAANLLCRLPEPLKFLSRLPDLVRSGGQLVMATPATWWGEFTPAKNQPPGLTLEFLKKHIGETFALQKTVELPFFIREHARKCQISTSQTSLWVRK